MIIQQTITLSMVGSFVIHREHSFGQPGEPPGHVAHSHCLFCPGCQGVWAWLKIHGETLTWPVAQSCAQCKITDPWMPVPGSILAEEGWGLVDTALLSALPEPLLQREFVLHLEAYSK